MELFNKSSTKDKRKDLRRKQTDAEDALWQQLRGRKIAGTKFLRQYGIGEYIADFYCPRHKLVIEIDGIRHSDGDVEEYDKAREKYMNYLNIKTIRFNNADVLQNMNSVLSRIERELTL